MTRKHTASMYLIYYYEDVGSHFDCAIDDQP